MAKPESREAEAAVERVRLDKWLWAARFFKTRALAADAIESGQVRVNDERVKPSRGVHVGERVTIRRDGLTFDVEIVALSDRRGPASEAVKLYRESPESVAAREAEIARRREAAQERVPGRPTKRDRRKLQDFLDEP